MKTNTAIICLSLLLRASQPALSWGDDGHKTIALIAQQCLTQSAKNQVAAMLATDIRRASSRDGRFIDYCRCGSSSK
jgi:hypothetical protein